MQIVLAFLFSVDPVISIYTHVKVLSSQNFSLSLPFLFISFNIDLKGHGFVFKKSLEKY